MARLEQLERAGEQLVDSPQVAGVRPPCVLHPRGAHPRASPAPAPRAGRAHAGTGPPAPGASRRSRPARRGLRRAVEPAGEALVQLGARLLRQRVVGGVADQQVTEAERVVARRGSPAPGGSAPCARAPQAALRRCGRSAFGASSRTAPRWNTLPSTAPRSITARSSAREAARAARPAAPGSSAATVDVAALRASATISSRKSGLPSQASMIALARLGSSPSPRPSSRRAQSSAAKRLEQDRGGMSLPPAQPGRPSRSSGRARQRSRSGVPRERSATWSSRSRSIGSAQCRSSKTATSGPLGGDGLELLAHLPRRGPPARRVPPSADAASSVGSARVAELHQHLDQRPERDPVAVVEAAAADDRRFAVEPGEELRGEPRLADARRPEQRERWQLAPLDGARRNRLGAGRAHAPSRRAARPRRATAGAPRRRLEQPVGLDRLRLPFQRRAARRARPRLRPRRGGSVAAPSRISPGAAACSSRAATLTASPVARVCPLPTTTSPVLTPVRSASSDAELVEPSSGEARRGSRRPPARPAARRPRAACGMPKTAITASPMNFSTVPPWRSTTAAHLVEVAAP